MIYFKHLLLLAFVLVATIASIKALEVEEEDDVLVLTEDVFDEVIEANELILVEFYAPWCGHCKKLAPEYAKAAAKLKKNDPPIPIAKVDATVEKSLGTEYGVKGFPTLKVFKNGQVSDYEGGRTESSIVSYMKKKAGPIAKTLDSVDDAKKFVDSGDVAIIGFFEDVESKSAKVFLQLADGADDFSFGITSSADVKSEYGVSSDTVAVFKTYDEPRTDFSVTESTGIEDLAKDVIGATTYLIETFSNDRAKAIFAGPVQVHALILTDPDGDAYSALDAGMREVAAEMKGKILFVIVPTSESRVYDYFGVKTSDTPAFLISDMSTEGQNKKYFFEGKIESTDEVKTFVSDVLEGKLTPTLKSEEPEEEDLAEPVKVVKGKSFEDIVMNNKNDVLLEFYAPWCGHCKNLAPIYDELAENFEDVKTVTIAKMDATANEIDHPKVSVKGFPTIYFFPGDAKDSPVVYSGDRDLDGFTEFLKKNAVNSFTLDGVESGKSSVAEEL